jgi:hypothetical protein
LLRKYGSLEAVLKSGRFPALADQLRLFRSIATMNTKAPLPRLLDQKPNGKRRPISHANGSSTSWQIDSPTWRTKNPARAASNTLASSGLRNGALPTAGESRASELG